jgi:hypothetical protein
MNVRRHLSYANVMSTIAGFGVVAGGGAYAASKVGSRDIQRNAVAGKHIKKGAVRGHHVRERTLDARRFSAMNGTQELTCNPTGEAFVDCAAVTLNLPRRGRALVVATGADDEHAGRHGGPQRRRPGKLRPAAEDHAAAHQGGHGEPACHKADPPPRPQPGQGQAQQPAQGRRRFALLQHDPAAEPDHVDQPAEQERQEQAGGGNQRVPAALQQVEHAMPPRRTGCDARALG